MNLFFYRNEVSAKALIENHYWKYEFTFETSKIYSTFLRSIHVLLILSNTDNTVGIYSTLNSYKPHVYKNIIVVRNHTMENGLFSFDVNILDFEEYSLSSDNEDEIYDSYDLMNTLCTPRHMLFYNNPIVRAYDWSYLTMDVDYKLLNKSSIFNEPLYVTTSNQYQQVLLSKEKSLKACHHMGKRMKNTTGGYKQILFDIVTDTNFVCPCSLIKFINEKHKSVQYTYILLSYKLSQLFLWF